MARGFESKDVEYQQAERERARRDVQRPGATPEQQLAENRRATIRLSLTRLRADLERARVPAHRAMLEQAIATLDAELASLS
ncbi:MAG: hypothetical protein AB7H96_00430 [Vicinamibacterales bacterium]